MTPRLPIVGADTGTWGDLLNEYELVSHNADGSLKPSAALAAIGGSLPDPGITSTVSGGHNVNVRFSGQIYTGGITGLHLSRDAAVNPVGINLWSTQSQSNPDWFIGLDATTTNIAIYSPANTADHIRLALGGFMQFGDVTGAPGVTHRLHLKSTGASDTLTGEMVYTEIASGSPATYHLRGQNAGTNVYGINAAGKANFGDSGWQGIVGTGFLEVSTYATIYKASGDAALRIRTTTPTTQNWDLLVKNSDQTFRLTDATTGRAIIRLAPGIPSTVAPAIDILATGSILMGAQAIATTATDGFLHITAAAGAPTGVATAHSGYVPMYYDTTNHKIWVYDGGWKGVVVA